MKNLIELAETDTEIRGAVARLSTTEGGEYVKELKRTVELLAWRFLQARKQTDAEGTARQA